ncbi:MAG: hypothetical protein ACPGVG_15765 [Mycobacterium sp.]
MTRLLGTVLAALILGAAFVIGASRVQVNPNVQLVIGIRPKVESVLDEDDPPKPPRRWWKWRRKRK